MKNKKNCILWAVAMVLLVTACNSPQDIPTGCWQSLHGRPSLMLEKDSAGDYQVIIHHRMANGRVCPMAYPLVREARGMYIQAQMRIMIFYNSGDSTLFLSPGGAYHLKK